MSLYESQPNTRLCDPNRGVDRKYEPLAKKSWLSSQLRRADAAERVRPPSRAAAAVVDEERALDEILRLGAGPDELERALRDERLDDEVGLDQAGVGAGVEPLRQLSRAEAPQVHRQVLVEAVVDLRAIVMVVV